MVNPRVNTIKSRNCLRNSFRKCLPIVKKLDNFLAIVLELYVEGVYKICRKFGIIFLVLGGVCALR